MFSHGVSARKTRRFLSHTVQEFLMKKTLAILSLAAASSFAVVKPYFGASLGYTLGQPSSNIGEEETSSSTKAVYGSPAGNAIPLGVHFGVMDNDVVGAQLDVSYLMGQEQETGKSPTGSSKSTLSGLLLTPSVVIAAKGPFTPYAKFGMIVGVNMSLDQKTTNAGGSVKNEFTGGTAFGFEGALGGEFKLRERMGITLEFAAQNIKWAPTEGTNTSITGLGINQTTTSYVDEHTIGAAHEALKEPKDLSNLAIKIGINYHL
ncbi:MAG: hypothetical protein RL318_955 [Fibrobacterota bacterium]|jgi:opacity protein-like surface antigen